LFWLSAIVLLPLLSLIVKPVNMGWPAFWRLATDTRVVAAIGLSLGSALIAAAIDAVFGLVVAWALTRYHFPGRRLLDAMIDLPFALPTAVAGIALAALYAGCSIKGNVNKKGQRIYHLPGQENYADIVITAEKGERYFCSEEEAVNAGWRKAKR
jgi:ABC-type sulfate transport system permease component